VPAHQAAYRKKIADETIAADTALAAAHTAKRTAASQRLSGIKHRRPSQSAPLIRSKISMTAAEWRRVFDPPVTGVAPDIRSADAIRRALQHRVARLLPAPPAANDPLALEPDDQEGDGGEDVARSAAAAG